MDKKQAEKPSPDKAESPHQAEPRDQGESPDQTESPDGSAAHDAAERLKAAAEGMVGGVGGLLKGVVDIVQKLGDLADKGEELKRSGEVRLGGAKDVRGMYGVSVKLGVGGAKGKRTEPAGTPRTDAASGRTEVGGTREPMVDVFEEPEYTLVVADMPGVGVRDLHLDLTEDILTMHAEHGAVKYHKEVLLPRAYDPKRVKVLWNNGIVEIRCFK